MVLTVMNDEEAWYRPPDDKIRPGDVFRLTPSLRALKPPLRATGNREERKGRTLVELFGDANPLPTRVANGASDGSFIIPGQVALGVLLTRGCEVDNGRARQVALVRPLSGVQPDGSRTAEELKADIIDGKMFSGHFLPGVPTALGGTFGDSYVDFRYISTLDRTWVEALERPVSLTRTALHHLYFAWMRHTTGYVPTPGPCPACNETIPLLVEQPGLLTPPEDW